MRLGGSNLKKFRNLIIHYNSNYPRPHLLKNYVLSILLFININPCCFQNQSNIFEFCKIQDIKAYICFISFMDSRDSSIEIMFDES